jgi:hypothetical protein
MLMLNDFLQGLLVSATIVYVTYFFMRVTAYCVVWLIGTLSFKQSDHSHRYVERTLSNVGEGGVRSGQALAFPILREANHASVE